jgi:hypothetical protein
LEGALTGVELPHLTIDTNCVIHSVQAQQYGDEVDELVRLARLGVVDLSLTTAFDVDQERAGSANRALNLQWLSERPMIDRIPQPARWGYSDWGGGSVWAPDGIDEVSAEIERLVLSAKYRAGHLDVDDPDLMGRWRRKVTDVQHLLAHHMSGNDAFVTSDEDDMVKKRDALQAATGIVIYTLPQAVQFIRSGAS